MARRKAAKKFVETVFGKRKPTKDKANTEDFYNVEFDLKARGMTPAQREKLAKKMGFDTDSAKKVRTKDARGKLPKAPKSGTAKKKPSGPKADPQNVARLQAAAAKPKTPKGKKPTGKKPAQTKMQKLQRDYDDLRPTAKNAEREMGKKSKYYPVFKARGMTEMKAGGYMKKKMAGGGSLKMVEKKKMGGGQVYKRKHGGKTVSGNDGNSIVAACYD